MTARGGAGDTREAARLAALHRTRILDTPPEAAFEDAVALVRTICRVPIALVSLVDADRQWFKAKTGITAAQTERDTSVCSIAIRGDGLFVIPDLTADPATAGMALVTGDPHARFYAGVPLVTSDGFALGSVCAIDTVARPGGLSDEQATALSAIARQVVAQIELRGIIGDRARAAAMQDRRQDQATRDTALLHAMLKAQQRVLHAGGAFEASLAALVEAALEAVPPADGVVVELVEGRDLVYRAASGTSAGRLGLRVPIAGSLSGHAVTTPTTVIVADAQDDPRGAAETLAMLDIRSLVIVPLVRHGEVFGALKLHAARAGMFRSRHVMIAQMLAGMISASFTEIAEVAALRSVERAEQHHRDVIDSAIDSAIIATDADGIVTSWSRGCETIFGWSAAEMVGRSLERIFTPEDIAGGRPAEEMALARAHGRASDERWHMRKDGSRFFANGALTPLVGSGGGYVKALRDVTVEHRLQAMQREAEDRFRVSRERLELATRAAGLGSFDFLPQTGALDWDARCRALFGVASDAPVTYEDTFLAAVHPDDRAAVDAAVAAALDPAGEGRYAIDYRITALDDGTPRTLAAHGLVLFVDGQAVRFIGTVQDVSADRRARGVLRETEERLRLAAHATNDAIWDWDLRRDHVLWNEALTSAYGHRLAEVDAVGDWWISHIHPDDRDRIDRSIHAVIDGTSSGWTDEYRFERADGSYADVRDRGYVIRDEQGRAIRMLGAMLDQSERKRVERELTQLARTLEQRVGERTAELDQLWRTSPDLLVVVDADGIVQRVNPAWTTILGYAQVDLIGSRMDRFVHPDDRGRMAAAVAQATAVETPGTLPIVENRYLHADGSVRWFAWAGAITDGEIYATGRDITTDREAAEALQRAEDQLRQAQKMEAVGQLTGGVAHDFNNLLTVIRGSVELLRRPGLSDERRRRYIDAIADTSERATRLTSQLLAFARRSALTPEVFDVGASLRALNDMVGTLVGSAIDIRIALPECACFVHADPSQFDTAIVNMAVNARDAMHRQGVMTIGVAAVDGVPGIRAHPPIDGAFVAISIADTGEGIPRDRIDQIFEPFFTTKDVGEGTGLGLSQVFGFAKQSGGEILVESQEGEGAVFTLYLPRVSAEAVAVVDRPHSEPSPGGQGAFVLVVEDNPDVGSFATQALAELGYRTDLAGDARQALAMLAAGGTYDVVFSDVVMPGMTGVAMGLEIRRLYPDLPVVLTSGYSEVLAQDGPHGFDLLHKPYSIETLSRILRKVVRRAP